MFLLYSLIVVNSLICQLSLNHRIYHHHHLLYTILLYKINNSLKVSSHQGCICQIFTEGGGSEFPLAMTDRATIAGMEVAKLVSGV